MSGINREIDQAIENAAFKVRGLIMPVVEDLVDRSLMPKIEVGTGGEPKAPSESRDFDFIGPVVEKLELIEGLTLTNLSASYERYSLIICKEGLFKCRNASAGTTTRGGVTVTTGDVPYWPARESADSLTWLNEAKLINRSLKRYRTK